MSVLFEKVAVLGLGLIGSSLCHAMRSHGIAGKIIGHAKSAETRETALEIGLVDAVLEHAADAVTCADLVILCAPVGACAALAAAIKSNLKLHSIA